MPERRRENLDFYKENTGLVAGDTDGEYAIYRFGIYFNLPGVGAFQNHGNWASGPDASSIDKKNNPQNALKRSYMHELIWHGNDAMDRYFERKNVNNLGDLGYNVVDSADPLYISPADVQEIRDAVGMEPED